MDAAVQREQPARAVRRTPARTGRRKGLDSHPSGSEDRGSGTSCHPGTCRPPESTNHRAASRRTALHFRRRPVGTGCAAAAAGRTGTTTQNHPQRNCTERPTPLGTWPSRCHFGGKGR